MATKKIDTLTLTSGAGNALLPRGRIELDKGRRMYALALKMKFSLTNSTGGGAALTDAQKRALLATLRRG